MSADELADTEPTVADMLAFDIPGGLDLLMGVDRGMAFQNQVTGEIIHLTGEVAE